MVGCWTSRSPSSMSAVVRTMRSLRVTRLSSSQLMVAASVPTPPSPAPAGVGVREAVALTESMVAAGALPCAVMGVSDALGTIAIHAVPGRDDRRVAPDSVFFLASVTKPIVATAIMQLVDEGRLDLHVPIARYVPGYGGGDRDRITAWHLLTHTSGLPDVGLEHLTRGRPSFRTQLTRVMGEVPTFEPGSRYAYASNSFYLLAAAIATLTGMAFPVALRTRVLAPLGMVDTSFDPRPQRSRTQQVHGVRVDNFITRELMVRFLASATLPGGGLFGPTEDLLRFGRAMLPQQAGPLRGARILSQWAIDEMTREQTAGILEHLDDGTTRHPEYGLGWHRATATETGEVSVSGVRLPTSTRAFTHAGASGTRLWVDPERGLVFVLLSNQWGGSSVPAMEILAAVYRGWPG
jgi:CubicO group peptidase (beta-lactamase class C family)